MAPNKGEWVEGFGFGYREAYDKETDNALGLKR